MLKRIAALILLTAWIPQAHAFPPCPLPPMEYGSPGEGAALATGVEPWFKADYHFVGDSVIIAQIAPHASNGAPPLPGGKCKDQYGLPMLASHSSVGTLRLNPRYAPRHGFGIVELPYLPQVTTNGMGVEYTLKFMVDNARLIESGEWADVAQLDFFHNGSAGQPYSQAVSSIYRVRKIQHGSENARIEVIESRALATGIQTRPPLIDQVVAVIPLPSQNSLPTEMGLRWTQTAYRGGSIAYDIDGVLEVLGPGNAVLYTTQLPGQWASLLSMGLLDYNVINYGNYKQGDIIDFNNVTIGAKYVK